MRADSLLFGDFIQPQGPFQGRAGAYFYSYAHAPAQFGTTT